MLLHFYYTPLVGRKIFHASKQKRKCSIHTQDPQVNDNQIMNGAALVPGFNDRTRISPAESVTPRLLGQNIAAQLYFRLNGPCSDVRPSRCVIDKIKKAETSLSTLLPNTLKPRNSAWSLVFADFQPIPLLNVSVENWMESWTSPKWRYTKNNVS